MKNFVFITDLHINTSSKVRNGDLVDDLSSKLLSVQQYCNENDAQLLLGGDIFDRPSLPDFIKSKFASIFKGFKYTPISISGNHDQLYANPEFNYKTSYNVFTSCEVLHDLDSADIDLGEVYISSTLPVKDHGKPQIFLYHGFLNQEDGRNTFHFQDIEPGIQHPVYICLGHDHVVYDPLQYTPNVKIFRPGSFLRGIRADSQQRNPTMLHIRVTDDGRLQNRLVPIKCRDANEIFKTKEVTISKSQQANTYQDIIEQIKNAQQTEMTFEQALAQVTSEEVVSFTMSLLNKAKLENSNKRQNL